MGRPQFESVVANAPREIMQYTSLGGQSYNIPAGGSQSFMIYAPKGFIGTLEALYVNVPAAVTGATSGSNIVSLGYQNISQARGIGAYNKAVQYYCNEWAIVDTQNPSPGQPQYAAVLGMIFDDVTAFRMTYVNQTNAAFNGVIDFRVVSRLRQVAK